MIKPKDVTIIIPHLGGSRETENALFLCTKSLYETVPIVKRIVVYNKGFSGEGRSVNQEEQLMVLTEQGQCKAVNAAVATTNTPWIFVTNDDMIYPPGWFEKLVTISQPPFPSFDLDPEKPTCISPKLIEPRPGAPTFEAYFCGGAGGDFNESKFLEFARSYRGQGLRTGFNLPFLISRALWDLVGGYDINYDPWGSNSDSDLEYKIKLAGIQPYQNTESIVYHFSQTSGTFEPRNQEYWQKNWNYFTEKWGFPRTDDGIWQASFTIPEPPIRKFQPRWEGVYEN